MKDLTNERSGVFATLLSCALGSAAGVFIFAAFRSEPSFSPTVGIVLRILASLSCLLLPWLLQSRRPQLHNWRDGRELWLWGAFGVLSLTTYYYSVLLIGAGTAVVLHAGSGVFIAYLSPILTKQRLSLLHVLAATGCLLGLLLLWRSVDGGVDGAQWGLVLASSSGLFTAFAYLMVVRVGPRHNTETVLLHWIVVSLAVMAIALAVLPVIWPTKIETWLILILAALCMAWSQYFTAVAYQRTRASLVACISFLAPLLSVLLDAYVFKIEFSPLAIVGVVIVVLCGLIIPSYQMLLQKPAVEPASSPIVTLIANPYPESAPPAPLPTTEPAFEVGLERRTP